MSSMASTATPTEAPDSGVFADDDAVAALSQLRQVGRVALPLDALIVSFFKMDYVVGRPPCAGGSYSSLLACLGR